MGYHRKPKMAMKIPATIARHAAIADNPAPGPIYASNGSRFILSPRFSQELIPPPHPFRPTIAIGADEIDKDGSVTGNVTETEPSLSSSSASTHTGSLTNPEGVAAATPRHVYKS